MYLKVNDGKKDYYYNFDNKPVVKVGRSSSNDISLDAEGVSRNHIEIHTENGEHFIIDQGATNGSFINEERIEANKKVPFNTFFPVQLGFYAKIFLIDEANTKVLDTLVKQTKQELEEK